MWGPQMIGKLVNINLQAMHQLSLQNNKHLRKCVMTCADFAQQLRLKGLNVEVMRSTVGSQQSSRALCTFTQHHHKIPAWWRKLFAQLLWSRCCLSLTDAGSPWQRFQREFGSFPLLLSTFLYAKEKGKRKPQEGILLSLKTWSSTSTWCWAASWIFCKECIRHWPWSQPWQKLQCSHHWGLTLQVSSGLIYIYSYIHGYIIISTVFYSYLWLSMIIVSFSISIDN